MRQALTCLLALTLTASGSVTHSAAREARNRASVETRPNFLLIVADDLGWSDLGSFGGEVATPNLDALAYSGVRFTGFHTSPTCSPTRAMLLTGMDNHRAGLGAMAEAPSEFTRGVAGYEGHLNDRATTVAALLGAGGYRTVMSGKWHLGLTEKTSPSARGFERSFALLQGAANHYGADQATSWKAAGFSPSYRENDKLVRYPRNAYSSDYFTTRLIEFLKEAAAAKDERPFFAYLSFTAPHWPLQAPDASIRKYRGRYRLGYEVLRQERLARQVRLGLVAPNAAAHPFVQTRPWASLNARERAFEARTMEVYAAMVDRMDYNVGRVVKELKRLGRFENTIIIFMSDNGPSGNPVNTPDFATGKAADAELGVNNRVGNIGRATSFVGYGPGWAQANSAPARLMKGYPTEGGMRVAAFASGKGIIGDRRIVSANIDVRDIVPTLLDLAGVRSAGLLEDRPVPPPGQSLRQVLSGQAAEARRSDDPLGYELHFFRALRKGDWKITFFPRLAGQRATATGAEGRWQLFNVAQDPGEMMDLSATDPAKLRELHADYENYARANGVVPPPPSMLADKPGGS